MVTSPAGRKYPPYGLSGTLRQRVAEGRVQDCFKGSARDIVRIIERDWTRAGWASATNLANLAACEKATLSRFIRQLGYSDYRQFQVAARVAASQDSGVADPGLDENDDGQTGWLIQEHKDLEHDKKSHIMDFNALDLAHHADQVRFVAGRLSRAKKICIAAGTLAAAQWCPSIRALFAAGLNTRVEDISGDETLKSKDGNHLIILHIGPPDNQSIASSASNAAPAYDFRRREVRGVNAVHIVIGRELPNDLPYDHRVLHVHDGSDLLSGIAMMIDTCIIMIREIVPTSSAPSVRSALLGDNAQIDPRWGCCHIRSSSS